MRGNGLLVLTFKFLLCVSLEAQELPDSFVVIPAGTFTQGLNSPAEQKAFSRPNTEEFKVDRLPTRHVTMASFAMEQTEVTNDAFSVMLQSAYEQGWLVISTEKVTNKLGTPRRLVNFEDPFCDITFNDERFAVRPSRGNHPVVAVTWYGACFYAWARNKLEGRPQTIDLKTWSIDFSKSGYRLPAEAEWEYAARGGAEAHWFPWGERIAQHHANFFQSGDAFDDPYGYPTSTGTTPVGHYDGKQTPKGPDMTNGYGLCDMAGNVQEWCSDWYAIDAYGGKAPQPINFKQYYKEVSRIQSGKPANNPKGPATGEARVLRGGSWRMTPKYLGCSMRFADFPERADRGTGFRIALTIPSETEASAKGGSK